MRWFLALVCLVALALASAPTNPYKVLELRRSATEVQIKTAYKRLAKKYHPDVNKDTDAQERFQEVAAAYEMLSDPQKKRDFDRYGSGGASIHEINTRKRHPSGFSGDLQTDSHKITSGSYSYLVQSASPDVVWLLYVHAVRCHHCKTVAPLWEEAVDAISGVVLMGHVSADSDRSLVHSLGVRNVPAILSVRNGRVKTMSYASRATTHSIIEFAQARFTSMPSLRAHAAAQTFLKPVSSSAAPGVRVLVVGKRRQPHIVLSALSEALADDISFAYTRSDSLCGTSANVPCMVVSTDAALAPVVIPKQELSTDPRQMRQLLSQYQYPLFVELTASNYYDLCYADEDRTCVVFFSSKGGQVAHELVLPVLRDSAEPFPALRLGWVHSTEQREFFTVLGMSDVGVSVAAVQPAQNKFALFSGSGELGEWLSSVSDDSIEWSVAHSGIPFLAPRVSLLSRVSRDLSSLSRMMMGALQWGSEGVLSAFSVLRSIVSQIIFLVFTIGFLLLLLGTMFLM